MEASIIVTYRCNARCHMCNTWQYPTKRSEEIKPEVLEKLPPLSFTNITGGEPFLRDDILDIVEVIKRKSKRMVISTNGFMTDRILDVARRHKDIGIRISIEGLPKANDYIRGLKDGFDHGLRTLLGLNRIGLKDIGFGITVSDRNARDMIELYQLAKSMKVEFATAAVHNGYYFHKDNNRIEKIPEVVECFQEIIEELLKTRKIKNWYRAYFNHGIINYIRGRERLLPCEAGTENFFVDPWGEVMPCNAMEDRYGIRSMGNLNRQSFKEIWNSPEAERVREMVRKCPKNCWMVGTAAPVMRKYIAKPTMWVVKNKLRGYRRGIRIAVLGTRGFPDVQGGVERHCQELYPRMAELGCEIRVYGRKPYLGSGVRNYRGVEIYPLWTPKLKSLEAIFHTTYGFLHAAFNRKGFDVIHFHAIGPSLLVPLAKLLGFKVVVTNHGPDYDRQKWGRIAKAALRIGERWGSRLADRVIAVSKVIKNNLQDRFSRAVEYIPNGVIIPDPVRPGDYLKKLRLSPGKYLLSVGRLVPEKGFHDLLNAFRKLKTDWKLVIAGGADHEDNYSRTLKKEASSDDRVVMTGMVKSDRLSELYSNAGLFVLPSYHEGLPIVLLEAMSYGRNVVCSSIPANTEVIDDPESLFTAGDIGQAQNRIADYLDKHGDSDTPAYSPSERLKEFNWDAIARKTFAVFESLVDGGRRKKYGPENVIEELSGAEKIGKTDEVGEMQKISGIDVIDKIDVVDRTERVKKVARELESETEQAS
jgi:radical SAM protein with 4Fe4S-binding SPASM domain